MTSYKALTLESIGSMIATLPRVADKLGGNKRQWRMREVGDGNLNLVFIAEGPKGAAVIKQALPYVRLVGESWPLPLERSYFEANALRIQSHFAKGLTPEVFYTDREQALIVMEYLDPHIILRKGLIRKIIYPKAATDIAEFMAQTLYGTSVLASSAADHKARVEMFAPNTALCKITEDLVFTDPYRVAPLNRWTTPYLDGIKSEFEHDALLKLAVQQRKWQFMTEAQALIHGDLHTGSVMVTEHDTRVIDPEFAFVGPMGFDIGAVIANYFLSYFSHARGNMQDKYQTWLLQQVETTWTHFEKRFLELWRSDGNGDAFSKYLVGQHEIQLERQRIAFMRKLFTDALGFAGCKMIRRILGLAHVEDMEIINDQELRASCETYALRFARTLILEADSVNSIAEATTAASAMIKGTRK